MRYHRANQDTAAVVTAALDSSKHHDSYQRTQERLPARVLKCQRWCLGYGAAARGSCSAGSDWVKGLLIWDQSPALLLDLETALCHTIEKVVVSCFS